VPRYNLEAVRNAASGNWRRVLSQICNVRESILTTREGPCPKCGGTGRFNAYKDFDKTGGVRCNQCFSNRNADGFAAIQWLTGCTFPEAISRVGELLNVKPEESAKSTARREIDPAKDLKFADWNELLAAQWCLKKKPIKPHALKAVNARMAVYRKKWKVIALPIIGQAGKPVGWCLYNVTGGTLPRFDKDGNVVDQLKIKVTAGSQPGVMGRFAKRDGGTTIKTEGPADLLALLSLDDLPRDVVCFCNAMGAGEDPAKMEWVVDAMAGENVLVIHDCDLPGQEGATFVSRSSGEPRPGWGPALATKAKECRNLVLPYEIEKSHGKDLRDWITDGHTFSDLVDLSAVAEIMQPVDARPEVIESPDDPHRLAKMNLNRYRSEFGRDLRYWRESWFSWKAGHYVQITKDHLRARIGAAIKAEFDRLWHEDFEKYQKWKKSEDYASEKDKGPPQARKVTTQLLGHVYEATKQICSLPITTEMDSWLDRKSNDWFVACENGILNLSQLLRMTDGDDATDIMSEHSPNWFSTIKLPYKFDPDADCPTWRAFVDDVFNGDTESIIALQKWFGYLLSPDKSLNKIMFVIGKQRSGKGTIARTIRAVLGERNIGTPTLAEMSQPFGLESLIGKTAALITDARISGRTDEVTVTERLLAISGDDPVNVSRKHISTLTGVDLKVRFTLFSNLIPRLTDHSSAFTTRCIFLAMPNTYLGREDLDLKAKLQAELPGILNWSIAGRLMLNQDRRIQQPKSGMVLVNEMRSMMSPVLQFIEETCEVTPGVESATMDVFEAWEKWCAENEVAHVGNSQSLSRKIKAIEPTIDTVQRRNHNGRQRVYVGLSVRCEKF